MTEAQVKKLDNDIKMTMKNLGFDQIFVVVVNKEGVSFAVCHGFSKLEKLGLPKLFETLEF